MSFCTSGNLNHLYPYEFQATQMHQEQNSLWKELVAELIFIRELNCLMHFKIIRLFNLINASPSTTIHDKNRSAVEIKTDLKSIFVFGC